MTTKSTDFVANSIDQAIIKREGMTDLFIRFRSTGSIRATSCIGESVGRKQRTTAFEASQLNRPRVSFERFPDCWFLHAGKAWAVKDCPVSVFKAVLRYAIKDEAIRELLSKSTDLDLITRWYVCCEAQSLQLFENQEKALQALQKRG